LQLTETTIMSTLSSATLQTTAFDIKIIELVNILYWETSKIIIININDNLYSAVIHIVLAILCCYFISHRLRSTSRSLHNKHNQFQPNAINIRKLDGQ